MASAHFEVSCNYMHIGDFPAKVCWRTKTCWQRPMENNRRIGMKIESTYLLQVHQRLEQLTQPDDRRECSTMIRWNQRLAKILRNSHESFIPRGAQLNQYSRQSSILNWSERMRNPVRRCFCRSEYKSTLSTHKYLRCQNRITSLLTALCG